MYRIFAEFMDYPNPKSTNDNEDDSENNFSYDLDSLKISLTPVIKPG